MTRTDERKGGGEDAGEVVETGVEVEGTTKTETAQIKTHNPLKGLLLNQETKLLSLTKMHKETQPPHPLRQTIRPHLNNSLMRIQTTNLFKLNRREVTTTTETTTAGTTTTETTEGTNRGTTTEATKRATTAVTTTTETTATRATAGRGTTTTKTGTTSSAETGTKGATTEITETISKETTKGVLEITALVSNANQLHLSLPQSRL